MPIGLPIGRPIFGRAPFDAVFADGVLSAAGVSTPAFTGNTFHDTVLSAAGVSVNAFAGNWLADVAFSVTGAGALSFAGLATTDGVLSASGVTSVSWTAELTADGAFSMTGTATGGAFYSAHRLFTPQERSSVLVDNLQTPTDGTLLRDPWTWP